MKSICKKCIHDFGDGCEAFRDEYMQILDKDECEDFDDGTCHTISVGYADWWKSEDWHIDWSRRKNAH